MWGLIEMIGSQSPSALYGLSRQTGVGTDKRLISVLCIILNLTLTFKAGKNVSYSYNPEIAQLQLAVQSKCSGRAPYNAKKGSRFRHA